MRNSDLNMDLHSEVARHDVRLDALESATARLHDLMKVTTRLEENVAAQAQRIRDTEQATDAIGRDTDRTAAEAASTAARVTALDRRTARLLRVNDDLAKATAKLETVGSTFVIQAAETTKIVEAAVSRLAKVESTQDRHGYWWITLWVITTAAGAIAGAVLASTAGDAVKRVLAP